MDNVTANAGSGGAVFATDDVAGVHYPIGKLAHGPLDSATLVSTSSGLPVQQQGAWLVTNAGTFAVQAAQSGTWTVQPGNTANTTAWLVTGAGGSFPVTDAGGSLTVDNGGTFVVQLDGAGLTALQLLDNLVLLEDAVHANGDPGVQLLTVRKDAAAALAGADGDYQPLVTDASGRLHTVVGNTVTVDTELGAAAAIASENVAAPTAPSVYAFGLVFDGTNWDRMAGTSADGLLVNLGANNDVDTELPAAAALADGAANPTAPAVGASALLFNGTTWDRARGDTTNGLDVDVTRLPALPAGTNNIGDVDVLSLPALPAGDNNIGNVDVVTLPAIPSGTNNIGDVDVLTLPAIPAGTNTVGDVGLIGRTSGGLTPHKTISAASTNATSAKGSAGQLFGIFASNVNAAARYLKLYDKATAPSVGTDVPILTLLIPGNTAGAGFSIQQPLGVAFANGIAFALTTGVADADTGAVAASELVVNLTYK